MYLPKEIENVYLLYFASKFDTLLLYIAKYYEMFFFDILSNKFGV